MKLPLLASDLKEEWISFKIPHDIFKDMIFCPMELEVDISPLLSRSPITNSATASTNKLGGAIC